MNTGYDYTSSITTRIIYYRIWLPILLVAMNVCSFWNTESLPWPHLNNSIAALSALCILVKLNKILIVVFKVLAIDEKRIPHLKVRPGNGSWDGWLIISNCNITSKNLIWNTERFYRGKEREWRSLRTRKDWRSNPSLKTSNLRGGVGGIRRGRRRRRSLWQQSNWKNCLGGSGPMRAKSTCSA